MNDPALMCDIIDYSDTKIDYSDASLNLKLLLERNPNFLNSKHTNICW